MRSRFQINSTEVGEFNTRKRNRTTKTWGSCRQLATKTGAVNMTGLNIDRGMLHYTQADLVYKSYKAMNDGAPDGVPESILAYPVHVCCLLGGCFRGRRALSCSLATAFSSLKPAQVIRWSPVGNVNTGIEELNLIGNTNSILNQWLLTGGPRKKNLGFRFIHSVNSTSLYHSWKLWFDFNIVDLCQL